MVSYELCPPPDSVEAGVGELRNIRYNPVGVNIADEIGNEGGLEARQAFNEVAFDSCDRAYKELRKEIGDGK